jgi:hypothetical protein
MDAGSFERGTWGEIVPAYLGDQGCQAALGEMRAALFQKYGKELQIPDDDREFDSLLLQAMRYVQKNRLRRILEDGEFVLRLSPSETALREAILTGRLVSLLPYGLAEEPESFAPVFQRIAGRRWRVGLDEYGQKEEFDEESPVDALARAQELCEQWLSEPRGV